MINILVLQTQFPHERNPRIDDFLAQMTDVVTKSDPNQTAFNERLEGVRAYCVAMRLPRDLQVRVLKSYKHVMRERSAAAQARAPPASSAKR